MNKPLIQALRIKPFLFLWLAEIFAQTGINMMNFILILLAYSLTHSNTAVSGIVIAFTIPAILFGVLAGVYVDRMDKKNILFATNAIRAALLLILAFAHSKLLFVYFMTFLITIATQFFIPAETPIIPSVVPSKLLLSANALFGVALYGSILTAYALAGPVLLFFGTRNALFLLTVIFLVASGFIVLIKTPLVKNKKIPNQRLIIKKEIKTAFAQIFQVKEIFHSFLLISLSQVLILIIGVIGPGYAQHIINIPINQFPILFITPAAIGMVISAVFLTTYAHRYSRQKITNLGLFILAVCVLLLPFGSKVTSREAVLALNTILPHILQITILHIMVVLSFLLGFANALVFVPSNTLIQEKTSDETRGKIYGVLNSTLAIFSLIPVIIAGSLADLLGVQSVLVLIGLVLLAIALYVSLKK